MLAHYENETKAHDSNDDGFADIPRVEQYNLWNRWAYMATATSSRQASKCLRKTATAGKSAMAKRPWQTLIR